MSTDFAQTTQVDWDAVLPRVRKRIGRLLEKPPGLTIAKPVVIEFQKRKVRIQKSKPLPEPPTVIVSGGPLKGRNGQKVKFTVSDGEVCEGDARRMGQKAGLQTVNVDLDARGIGVLRNWTLGSGIVQTVFAEYTDYDDEGNAKETCRDVMLIELIDPQPHVAA